MADRKVIITVAPTSNFQGKEANPALPIQPDEVAAAVFDAYNAGASLAHLHARDRDGVQTNDPEVFKEINARIRAKCPIIIQNSIAPALGPNPNSAEDGLAVLDAMPEMASLDMGISVVAVHGREIIIEWTRSFLRKAAKLMLDRGIKPELEIFNDSQIDDALMLIKEGLLTPPYSFSFVTGMQRVNQGAIAYSPQRIMNYVNMLPSQSLFSTLGVGTAQLPATLTSILLGGNARVGFEDNIFYSKGVLASSNAQLVERLVRCIHDLGLEVASPDEARAMLGVPIARQASRV
ncbi:MAG: 3-keto-5-aminohexanoate cleavage protein [Sulfuritalea sp.]|jgi:3-keto-5-aminohexanoate cleavage enzyme|nr:3-keto-5-aminohexanoate cleavage protein [Sulfuritalea sp.]